MGEGSKRRNFARLDRTSFRGLSWEARRILTLGVGGDRDLRGKLQ